MSKIKDIEQNLKLIREQKKSDDTLDALLQLTQMMLDNLSGRYDGAKITREWVLNNIKLVLFYGRER